MPRTPGGGLVLAEEDPTAPRRRGLVRAGLALLLIAVLAVGAIAGRNLLATLGGERCQATASGSSVTFDPEQMSNAATIVAIAARRGLPARAATIAIATAIQESKLRNITYGDRDSVGLFQQRPSQGWGTREQILNPEYAAGAFYDALVKVEGYESMEITKVAQEVQKSAYPEAYTDHEQEGRVLASTLSGHSPAGFACRLKDAGAPDVSGLQTAMQNELGLAGRRSEGSPVSLTVTVPKNRQTWGAAQWAVAKAADYGITSVEAGGTRWSRTMGRDGLEWKRTGGAATGSTVKITLAASSG
ncbi:MAG: hypothetical protein LWW86_10190 [Micrococcales bacterium]|nr:hypothetical protein [Micrococcales bacterium]